MGTTQHSVAGHPRFGAYDGDIVRDTSAMTTEQAKTYAASGLQTRLGELGVGGYLRLLWDKSVWNWGDAMFWAWSEGIDGAEPRIAQGRLTDFAASWNRPDGSPYGDRAALSEAIWLALLLTTGLRLLRARWRWELGLLALSVLGIAAFTLLFQGRSRYLFVYVPVVISLACVLPAVLADRSALWSRVRR